MTTRLLAGEWGGGQGERQELGLDEPPGRPAAPRAGVIWAAVEVWRNLQSVDSVPVGLVAAGSSRVLCVSQ